MKYLRLVCLALFLAGMAVWSGCWGSPSVPKGPSVSAGDLAQRIMEQYDANHDKKLDAEEIKKSGALRAAMQSMDPAHEGTLTEEKIARRVNEWLKSGSAVFTSSVTVLLDDKPLEGATVTIEPEECMGPAYKPTSAVTDANGNCAPPGDDPQYPGLHMGLYRVRISKLVEGQETIPDRYNKQTELGLEAGPSTRSWRPTGVFKLSSK
jgi:hypothetical protein